MDELDAEIVGRRVAVALAAGNAEWAHAIIDSVFNGGWVDVRELTVGQKIELPIAQLFPLQRDERLYQEHQIILGHLEDMGIRTIGDLLNTTQDQLLESSNFGERRLHILLEALKAFGFKKQA